MRKIKRFVLNDSFTVLSAEAQKNVLGGAGPFSDSWDTCNMVGSSTCPTGNPCLFTYSWGFSGHPWIAPSYSYGWTGYGHCAWNGSTNSCSCNVESIP